MFALIRPVDDVEAAAVLVRLQRRLPQVLAGVDCDTRLDRLLIDSLDLVELLCATEDEFGVRLTPAAFQRAATAGELARSIARRARKAVRS